MHPEQESTNENGKKNLALPILLAVLIVSICFTAFIFIYGFVRDYQEAAKKSDSSSHVSFDVFDDNFEPVDINNAYLDSETLNVLLIEINPILHSITNPGLYKNNEGHPTVSEYFAQDKDAALREIIEDIEDSSHGYLKINIMSEYLDEFPTYKRQFTLPDGTRTNRLDESTYLSLSRIPGSDRGNWYGFINSPYIQQLFNSGLDTSMSYSFDYDYIADKFNLDERKNNNEFDQVWLLTIDPSFTYETTMAGLDAYWVNGNPVNRDSDEYVFFNISISRRDSNFHAYGHSLESIMENVYDLEVTSGYKKGAYDVTSLEDYQKLNDWQKFELSKYNNSNKNYTGFTGVGNVHFPFNGESDYDYQNNGQVYTNWRDWLEYPNIHGNFVLDDSSAWLNFDANRKIVRNPNENSDPDRLYMRFMTGLMPHVKGYSDHGYLSNWWVYFKSLDHVIKIDNALEKQKFIVEPGTVLNLKYTLRYISGESDIVSVTDADHVLIGDPSVIDFRDGKLTAIGAGETDIMISRDGKVIFYYIEVVE